MLRFIIRVTPKVQCTHFSIQVSTNGYMALWPKKPRNVKLPKLPPSKLGVPILAPFWADLTTQVRSRLTKVTVEYRRTVVKFADLAIKNKFRNQYAAKKSFYVKWYRVPFAGETRSKKVRTLVT